MTTAYNYVENRSSRALTISLADGEGRPAGRRIVIRPHTRRRFPSTPLVVGQTYNLTARYARNPAPGDYNFAMREGNLLIVSYTDEGPIYNQPEAFAA